MRIEAVEVMVVGLPLREAWTTAVGSFDRRDVVLVRVRTDGGEGWGECAALPEPGYTSEYVAGARSVLVDHLVPLLTGRTMTAADVGPALSAVAGHPMAKSALEMAVLDAELRAAGTPFATWLGATRDRVPAGVALSLADPSTIVERVTTHVEQGYGRVKLKVGPGHDTDVLAAVRDRFGDLALQVDANGVYGPDDVEHLAGFDRFDLQLIEQPFAADDLLTHARLAAAAATLVCLDEPIVSLATLESAVALGACEVVNCKPGRVGGYLTARRIEAWCRERGIGLWCGGMLETGLGRAANVALAALDGFTLTGDLSASDRFYRHDVVTEPIAVVDGQIAVPTRPGLGFEVDLKAVRRFRVA